MRKILGISIITATMLTAGGDFRSMDNSYDEGLRAEVEALKTEVAALKAEKSQSKGDSADKKYLKLEKKIKRLQKSFNKVKAHDAKDNIKWGVDLRTSIDNIEYKMANGTTRKNRDLWANRLWLNMAYKPSDSVIFKGQLGYNKAYGADMQNGRGKGYSHQFNMDTYDQFDWITNEALTDNTIKLRQAYWLYLGNDFLGTGIPWTASLGRRPSTTGFLSNLREDDVAQSPLGHIIDVEFDGGSALLKLEKATGVSGMAFKLCMGQGGTNASPRFSNTGTDYAGDASTSMEDIRLGGFIFTPYDDGTIKVKTSAFKAFNLPGMSMTATGMAPNLSTKGDQVGGVISVLIDGLSDDMDKSFLYGTKIFASYAVSETRPDAGSSMLGSTDNEQGNSFWVGAQVPLFGGKFGVEYNKGSKYWRSFTYAEDTMVGSKLAARGDAIEAYYTQQLTKSLSAQIRYTKINYDYSGSNGFFGDAGNPMKISDIKAGAAAGNPMMQGMAGQIVEEAQDIRAYIRYRF